MIPNSKGLLARKLEAAEQESRSYGMDFEEKRIRGFVEGQEAMRQLIVKILNTERYAHAIYSWNYGFETADLYGMPVAYVYSELKRRISEALLQDTRIRGVEDFDYSQEKGRLAVGFTARTVFGDVKGEREVGE